MELEEWKINHAGRPAGPARFGLFYRYRYRSEKNLTGYNYDPHPHPHPPSDLEPDRQTGTGPAGLHRFFAGLFLIFKSFLGH
jgi:hypothetical protein